MLAILPHDCRFPGQQLQAGRPWVTLSLLVLAVLAALGEACFLSLPGWLQMPVGWLAYARLYSDPGDGLFRWWQLWTHLLVSDGWLALVVNGVFLWAIAGAVERRLGSLATGLALIGAVAVAASIFVIVGEPSADLGLTLAIVTAAGLAVGIDEHVQVRWLVGWWFLRFAGLIRFAVPMVPVVAAYAVWEVTRQLGGGLPEDPAVVRRYVPLLLLSLACALLVGHLLVRLSGAAAAWRHADS